MRRLATLAAAAGFVLALSTASHAADQFELDQSHTHIMFFVNHLGFSTIQGEFMDFDGTFMLDRENQENSSLDITIDVASLDTGWADRDAHLLSADFFEAATYPTARFVSTRVERTGENTALVHGELTVKENTVPVVLDVVLNKIGPNPIAEDRLTAGFSATGTVSRSDLGVGLYAPAIADEVELRIETETFLQDTDTAAAN